MGFWLMTGTPWAADSLTKPGRRERVRAEVHEVDLLVPEEFPGIVVDPRDAELLGERLALGARAVEERHALGALKLPPRGHLEARPVAGAEECEPQRVDGSALPAST